MRKNFGFGKWWPIETPSGRAVWFFGLLTLLLLPAGSLLAADMRPNILLIVAEDHGLHLSCYGDKNITTPHLDKLAEQGTRFERAYVPYASCSSSRSAIFTGRFPHQNGQIGLATHKFTMYRSWPTIPGILANAGYRTAVIGKIHVNPEEKTFKGFERIDKGIKSNFRKRDVRAVARRAGKYMGRSEKPFFLMVNYPDAHLPFLREQYDLPKKPLDHGDVTSPASIGVDTPRLRKEVANYYNCLKRLDTGVGMLLDVLDKAGKADNTVVIFLSDHGAQFSRGKMTCYESGLHVPLLIRWPSRIKPGQVHSELVMTVDLLPTILDMAGLEVPKGLPGRSLVPLFRSDSKVPWRKYAYGEYDAAWAPLYFPQRSICDERYKLIVNLLQDRPNPVEHYYTFGPGHKKWKVGTTTNEIEKALPEVRQAYATWRDAPPVELYDLAKDPHEFTNLAGKPKYAAIQKRLESALHHWRTETNDPLLDPKKLKRLTTEMDALRKDTKNDYRKDPNFRWQYPDYLWDSGSDAKKLKK
jgi:N-sulfoglucosamine sulfohydrolase